MCGRRTDLPGMAATWAMNGPPLHRRSGVATETQTS